MDLVKPIAGILTSRTDLLEEVVSLLSGRFGPADIVGGWQPFTHTSYYEEEMGGGLSRSFVSFERLEPQHLARDYKAFGRSVESRYAQGGRRSINLDPGYIDANKLVLVSAKYGGHKIALDDGVYADMLLWYNKGWQAQPWAFPDFRDGSLFPLFQRMRRAFKLASKAAMS